MPEGLKKRWQCWKLRLFVRWFRPDICLRHNKVMDSRCVWTDATSSSRSYTCDECETERREAEAAARQQYHLNTEEILEALRHCKECK